MSSIEVVERRKNKIVIQTYNDSPDRTIIADISLQGLGRNKEHVPREREFDVLDIFDTSTLVYDIEKLEGVDGSVLENSKHLVINYVFFKPEGVSLYTYTFLKEWNEKEEIMEFVSFVKHSVEGGNLKELLFEEKGKIDTVLMGKITKEDIAKCWGVNLLTVYRVGYSVFWTKKGVGKIKVAWVKELSPQGFKIIGESLLEGRETEEFSEEDREILDIRERDGNAPFLEEQIKLKISKYGEMEIANFLRMGLSIFLLKGVFRYRFWERNINFKKAKPITTLSRKILEEKEAFKRRYRFSAKRLLS